MIGGTWNPFSKIRHAYAVTYDISSTTACQSAEEKNSPNKIKCYKKNQFI